MVVQAAFVAYCWRAAPSSMCASAKLAAPAATRLTHSLTTLLSPLSLLSMHPGSITLARGGKPPDPRVECEALLRFLQLSVGLFAPLLWHASTEASLFAEHQRQRRHARLPPERGPSAALLESVLQFRESPAPLVLFCALMALGLCWSVAVGGS